jgi:ribonuclease Z
MKKTLLFLLAGVVALAAVALFLFRLPAVQDTVFQRVVNAALGESHPELFTDDALRALVCGSSAPLADRNRAKACIAVFAGGRFYVVDVGPESWENLSAWRIPGDEIGGVLLTHFHSDHIGDLGELNMQTWALGRPERLRVYGPPGVEKVVAGFSLAYELDSAYRTAHHGAELLSPEAGRMRAVPIVLHGDPSPARDRRGLVFDDGGLKVTAIEVSHSPVEPAYGYRFDYRGRSLVISGDTLKHSPLAVASSGADVLFHEAQANHMVEVMGRAAQERGQARLQKILSDITLYHTSPVEAAELANQAKVKLLVLYHFTPPILNRVAESIFVRGLAEVRPGGVEVARDGLLVELPVASEDVRVGRIRGG